MTGRQNVLRGALVVALVLAGLSIADAGGFRRHVRLEREVKGLQDRNQKLTRDNAVLLEEIEALRRDPKALERAAREELGYVKPGEVIMNME